MGIPREARRPKRIAPQSQMYGIPLCGHKNTYGIDYESESNFTPARVLVAG
jgi:hypothetical protein